jgi:hypothetical protein
MPAKTESSKKSPLGEVISIRLPEKTEAHLEIARKIMGLKEQEIIRLATEIGLAVLSGIKYDPAKLIAKFALENPPMTSGTLYQMREPEIMLVAEDSAPYSKNNDDAAKALAALHAQQIAKSPPDAPAAKPSRAAHK